ncbi:MAG: cell division topological specificity factor MinE [Eubacteriales bacterium]
MSVIRKHKVSSVVVAKQRLQQLLSSDRINCSPDLMNQMREDIFHTISKYMEIEPQNFEMTLTRKEMQIRYTGEK